MAERDDRTKNRGGRSGVRPSGSAEAQTVIDEQSMSWVTGAERVWREHGKGGPRQP